MKYIPGSSKYVEFLPFWVGVFSSKKAQVLYTKGRSSYYSLKKINNNNNKKKRQAITASKEEKGWKSRVQNDSQWDKLPKKHIYIPGDLPVWVPNGCFRFPGCEKSTICVRGFSLAPKLEGSGTHMFGFQEEKTRIWRDASSISNRKTISSLSSFEKSWRRWSYIFFRIFRNLFCVGRQKQEVWPVRFVFMCVFAPFFDILHNNKSNANWYKVYKFIANDTYIYYYCKYDFNWMSIPKQRWPSLI